MELDTIVCMDAVEFLRGLDAGSVDAVITDPPYGVGKVSAWRLPSERFQEIEGNEKINAKWLPEAYRILKNKGALYVFAKWQNFGEWQSVISGAGFAVRNCIVWDKLQHGTGDLETTYGPQYELILFAAKGHHTFKNGRPVDVVRCQKIPPDQLIHPYEKPTNLLGYFIKNSTLPSDIICDPFCGSGSTFLAARNLKRHYIGCDVDPHWVGYARDRLRLPFEPRRAQPETRLDDLPLFAGLGADTT